MQLSTRHLLGIKDLTSTDISLILQTAEQFKEVLQRPVKKVPSLRDVVIVNLFFENSTRTRISFELAEKRLSADTISLQPLLLPAKRKHC
jgi:aspartate carbamoyltransferase catalytic subunit